MYLIKKRMEIAYGHKLKLPYESKCKNLHGHNGIATIYCKSGDLDPQTGMVIDFTWLKKLIHDQLDHQCLNDILDVNPTAENTARWICDTINNADFDGRFVNCVCYRVDFQESEGNVATYIWDEENVR